MDSKKMRSFDDLDAVARSARHILTLFSGGLDSSYVLKALSNRGCVVTALAVNVGEHIQIHELEEVAERFGARLRLVDARKEFAFDAVVPAIRAQAKYFGIYPISSSLSRPILARCAVRAAEQLGCDAIVHTANSSQNSLRRLNGAIAQLGFPGWFGTPYELSVISRDEKIEALRQAGMPRFQSRGISTDLNLWCREFEAGSLDNPEAFWTPESLFDWTSWDKKHPPVSMLVVSFENGTPVAVDGERLELLPLISRLNHQVGAFGIGRYSGLEHLEGGEKVLEIREAPAAALLMDAYRHLETATLDAELLREKIAQEQLWVREAVEGRWFGPLREAADSFIRHTASHVTGTVGYRLRPGAFDVCTIKARRALYLTDRDEWEQSNARAQKLVRSASSLPGKSRA